MSWWGKLLGGTFGFMLGGPMGALLGAVLGHNFDKGLQGVSGTNGYARGHQQRAQAAFFTATFSVMGHICKADGRVTPDEIAAARLIMSQMELSPQQRQAAIELFNEGKKEGFLFQDIVLQFRQEVGRSSNLKRMFIEIQCHAAYSDGTIHPAEKKILSSVCDILRISQYELESIIAAIGAQFHHQQSTRDTKASGMSLKDAYTTLNISADATETEVKRAYRRLTSQHHPDKLVSKGLPEEMMKIASQRTHEIRQAYERIKQEM
ncbi:MAG: co-chaperone DjlA [Gammaproteobacteria bacterium]